MQNLYTLVFIFFLSAPAFGQKVDITPTITPSLFRPDNAITVAYDVTGTALESLPDAYIWVWIPDKTIDAKYNINPANSNTTATNNAKFVKSVINGRTIFTLTFVPQDFFANSIATETKLGFLLKGNDWNNGQTTDHVTSIWDGTFQIKLNAPTGNPLLIMQGEDLVISAETPIDSDFRLYVDNNLVHEQSDTKMFNYAKNVTENPGWHVIRLEATDGLNTDEILFEFFVSTGSPAVARPAGIRPGINYHEDKTKVTLCLWAPTKSLAYVRGDFSNWQLEPSYLMNRDGEYFWIELQGLTPLVEYGFQYFLEGSLIVADPYADKILDPDDQYISETIYPDLKSFPDAARTDKWYFNRVAILQTGQTPYAWQVENFQRPPSDKLVIYELLIRDFFAEQDRSYQNLTDTISYFKRLGVNAIQLMPVMEFSGNDSWGYNPTFMFAPDKAYGPKNKLKQFIDECHKQGLAVIFDIAMNHHDIPNPYLMMDYDFTAFKPTSNNKWFNVDAKHPYNVFSDMNHESAYTKVYLDTVNHYWLSEYKIDGYRFDLTKGFTQNAKCGGSITDESCISQKDQSRIDILTRMGNAIWQDFPDAYLILEHFADNAEETDLINSGFMVWGNLNYAYSQNSKGVAGSSDISWIYHKKRGWTEKAVVGYMESHDEERMMYRNLQEGATSGTYSVKNLSTALDRVKAAAVMFYTIPGPKMLWQFGELGYDVSINFNGRVGAKPVKWEYYADAERKELFDHIADLLRLRKTYPVFTDGDVSFGGITSLIKTLTIKGNPYVAAPETTDEMNVQIVINFDLTSKNASVVFPHAGMWYDYYNESQPLSLSIETRSISLLPGEFKLFTDVPLHEIPPVGREEDPASKIKIFPNPTTSRFKIEGIQQRSVRVLDSRGIQQAVRTDGDLHDISNLPSGLYFVLVEGVEGNSYVKKIVKNK